MLNQENDMTVLRIIHATIILVVPLIVTAAFNRKHVAFLSSFLDGFFVAEDGPGARARSVVSSRTRG